MKTPEELKALIDKKDAKIAKDEKIREEYFKELKRICPHTNTVKKSSYFSGSYNDKAYTNYWDECVCCGARLNKHTEMHSWYG